MKRASIGISAHLGWAATATIAVGRGGIRVLRTDRLEIGRPGDREIREPFHVAGGFEGLGRVPRPADPERQLEHGLRRQRRSAARAVAGLVAELEDEGYRIAFAGLLVGRGRAAPSFEQAVGSHTQIHVEEGLAVRDSLRRALTGAGACVADLDQKTLGAEASAATGRPETDLVAELRVVCPERAGSWRREEQRAALAAWVAWVRGAG